MRDWLLYHAKFSVAIGREDLMQALARQDFISAHLPEHEFPPRLCDVSPYIPDPLDIDDDAELEAVRARLSRPLAGRNLAALAPPGADPDAGAGA